MVVNIGYIILQRMLSTPGITNKSFSFGRIITRILKHFLVPITAPTFDDTKELRDDAIANLGFVWVDDTWVKNQRLKNKVTELAPLDHCIFNDVLSPDQLPNLSGPQRLYPRHPPSEDRFYSTLEDPSHSTSAVLEDPMQWLLSEVCSISKQQNRLQSQLEGFQIHFFF